MNASLESGTALIWLVSPNWGTMPAIEYMMGVQGLVYHFIQLPLTAKRAKVLTIFYL